MAKKAFSHELPKSMQTEKWPKRNVQTNPRKIGKLKQKQKKI